MNPSALTRILALLVLLIGRSSIQPNVQSSPPPVSSGTCNSTEHRQFDFWIGDWDAFDVGATTPVARLRVTQILDGCVLLEEYDGDDGTKGKSFSIYDASRQVWHQSWVTNHGKLLLLDGKFAKGTMVLTATEHISGSERQVRGTWKPVRAGVRETAVTSVNGGKTWDPWFDLLFRPHKEEAVK